MLSLIWAKIMEFLQDDGKPSFGKAASIPFLVTSWLVGTVYGGQLLWNKKDVTDLVWTMAGVAMVLYASYKTGSVIVKRGTNGKTNIKGGTNEETPSGG